MSQYYPNPIDTSDIKLPEEIILLSEELAKNIHEIWAKGRISEGWKYSKELNLDLKTHPSLIPYEQLSESEKDYDRRTSQETLKFILSKNFKIVSKND